MCKTKKHLIAAAVFAAAFIVFTALVATVNVDYAGKYGVKVGFAAFNGAIFDFIGESKSCYKLSEITGFIVIAIGLAFAVLGVYQLIKRKSFKKVDKHLYALAALYVVVAIVYVAFDKFPINYRPTMPDGGVNEPSYPSSHTLIALTVGGAAVSEVFTYFKSARCRAALTSVIVVVCGVTVIGRILAGVHWATDIIGGILLSASLVLFFLAAKSRLCVTDGCAAADDTEDKTNGKEGDSPDDTAGN